jgi:hypothetical protein
MSDTVRIQIENAAVEISAEGLERLLEGRGGDLQLSHLELRLSGAALQALIARLWPSGGGSEARAEISPTGLVIEGGKVGERLRLSLQTTGIRLQPGNGDVHLITEGGAE